MEDLLEPSPGNKFAALWTVACNYSTVALVLINASNTFNALCYLLWVPPFKWERSAVLPGGGDWNLRAELRQCRKQRAQVSSVIVAILCSICSHLASAALPRTLYRVSQEERTKFREGVSYVKVYRYNPKHLYPKLNGYGDNGQRKVWTSCISA